jgi:hypothetical protein
MIKNKNTVMNCLIKIKQVDKVNQSVSNDLYFFFKMNLINLNFFLCCRNARTHARPHLSDHRPIYIIMIQS